MKEKISCLEKFRSISHDMLMQISGNIRVYVRLRPQIGNQQEELNSINKCYNVLNDKIICRNRSMFSFPELDSQISTATCEMSTNEAWKTLLEIREPIRNYTGLKPRQKKWKFAFDRIFLPENKQNDVWNATEPLVQSFIDGHKVCIFTYGQTGSGKTYTMLGEPGSIETEGIIYRSARKIYAKKTEIESSSNGANRVDIFVEVLEVYNEKIRDLLKKETNERDIPFKLDSHNQLIGVTMEPVESEQDMKQILTLAQKRRCVRANYINLLSSRSHMLFTIILRVKNSSSNFNFTSKLNFVDLAGSERMQTKAADNSYNESHITETCEINRSLSALSNVIEKLHLKSVHVPYRDSKLTHLLQDSLGQSNSKTLAIICCSTLEEHFNESLCSLRFAAKASKVQLKSCAEFC